MHQATRVRFRGGDPLALTKRIQARRGRPLAHRYLDEIVPAHPPIEPIITTWHEAGQILALAGLILVFAVLFFWGLLLDPFGWIR